MVERRPTLHRRAMRARTQIDGYHRRQHVQLGATGSSSTLRGVISIQQPTAPPRAPRDVFTIALHRRAPVRPLWSRPRALERPPQYRGRVSSKRRTGRFVTWMPGRTTRLNAQLAVRTWPSRLHYVISIQQPTALRCAPRDVFLIGPNRPALVRPLWSRPHALGRPPKYRRHAEAGAPGTPPRQKRIKQAPTTSSWTCWLGHIHGLVLSPQRTPGRDLQWTILRARAARSTGATSR